MRERAIEEGEEDVLEEVISDDDLAAEAAALAGGGAPPAAETRSKPRPPGKGARQASRGKKRSAPPA